MNYTSSSILMQLLDRPIAFHPCLVRITGSVNAAILLGQAIYWSKRTKDDNGWFYKSQQVWEEETALHRFEQENARKVLRNKHILEEKKAGVPAKLFYRVNFEALEELTCKVAAGQQAGESGAGKQARRRAAGKFATEQQPLSTTETTTETTAEITSKDTADPAESAGGASAIPPELDEEAPADDPPTIGNDPTDGSPDRKQIIDEVHRLYQAHNPGIKVPWTDLAFLRLKREVERVKGWTTEQWLDCVRNRYASDGIILGELPESFIPYLSRYISGPMDRYGKAKGANSGNVSARTARNRAALSEVVSGIRKGFGIAERAG
jgi:hypothetical protein